MEHRHQQTLRYEELCNKLPAYRDLEDQIAALYADRARAAVLGQAVQLQDMLQQIQTLQHQQRILMTRAGYPSDYLALTYTCPDCHDHRLHRRRKVSLLQTGYGRSALPSIQYS